MGMPIQHLPVLQNWDCHVCGTCCQEYQVTLTPEEVRRIEEQGWDPVKDLGGHALFDRRGPFWRRRVILNHRADDSCVFLSEQGRCRIHERFGYEAKPLACRLYPFLLIPAGDHWAVGLRYACPSSAANKGRSLPQHTKALAEFAEELARREGLSPQPDGALTPPPPLTAGQRVEWPDVHRIVDMLLAILLNRRDPLERRLRKCLALASEMRRARLDDVSGPRLGELLGLLRAAADSDTPPNLMTLPRPGWVGRLLFRQALALFSRKDHGPNRGPAMGRGRISLLAAAWRFTRGSGAVPRMHRAIPETTFAEVETPRGPLPTDAEEILERYYHLKVGSLQFCGPTSFGYPFWEGFEALALTFPILLWVARTMKDCSRADAVMRALTIVDDHVGFNRVLASTRQRLSFRILARSGELSRLIAWYSR
jgi:lysine-N-methylase